MQAPGILFADDRPCFWAYIGTVKLPSVSRSALVAEINASNRLRSEELDTAKISETKSAFFHSTLDGTHAHVEIACHRFEAALIAH